MLYDDFKPVVDLVFNNWTALRLAVEHGMGAPGGKKTAQLMAVYVARYCVENTVDHDDLAEVLDDLMDEEFETSCRDNSLKEVATMLIECLDLLKLGCRDEVSARLDAMPKCQVWLSQPEIPSKPPQTHGNPDDDTTSCSDDDDDEDGISEPTLPFDNVNAQLLPQETRDPEPMDQDEDPGWTVVRTKKKQ